MVEQSELLTFFNLHGVNGEQSDKGKQGERNENSNKRYQALCFSTFCILLWDIQQHDKAFAAQLINGLIIHFLPTLYPTQAKSTDIASLKTRVAKQVAKLWHVRPEIKESFSTCDDNVAFALIAKIPPILSSHTD